MNGSDIKALLDQCISGGVLTINSGSNPLKSKRIDDLVANVFAGSLKASAGSATVGATSVTYPQASLQAADFAFYPQAANVGAVISVTTGGDGSLDCSVEATMPAGWTFAQSFAQIGAIKASALNDLAISACTISVDSAASTTNGLLDATITTAASAIAGLEWLLGANVTVSGPVGFTKDARQASYPAFTLSSSHINGPNISGFSIALFLNLRSAMGQKPLADGTMPLLVSVDLTTELITPGLTLPIMVGITSKDQTSLPISLDTYAPPPQITSLSQLSGFTWNQPVALTADTPLGALSLKSLSLALDPSTRIFSNLIVTVDLGTNWTIIDGILKLVGLEAQLSVPTLNGGSGQSSTPTFSINVTAEFVIVTADIDISIAYPDETLTLQLAPGTVIDINDFISALASGVTLPGSNDMQITTLTAIADKPNNTYSLTSSASGQLSIIPGFVLTELDLALTYVSPKLQSFQFGCNFTIAKAPLYLAVAWAQANWSIGGGTTPGQSINLTDLVADIASIFGVQLPSGLPQIVLSKLDMTYQTSDGSFSFDAAISYVPGNDPILTKIAGATSITYDGSKKAWTGDVSGEIVISETSDFKVDYNFQTDQIVSLSWTAIGNETVGIDDLYNLFGIPGTPPIPNDLDLALVQITGKYDITKQEVVFECKSRRWGSADIAVWNDKTSGWTVFFGLKIDPITISLTSIPLIGKTLASVIGDVSLKAIESDLASSALSADQAGAIGKLIDDGYPKPPEGGLPDGVALTMTFDAGGSTSNISIGTGSTTQTGTSTQSAPIAASSGPKVPTAPGTGTVTSSSDGTKWFSLQKSFGPVSIQKVGVRYSDDRLWALLNASISAGGLEIDTLGLGVGSPLDTFQPKFTVDGIVVSLGEGPVKFSGGLIGTIDPVNLYGELSVDFGEWGIGALAGYAQYSGHPSFFLYGVLNAPLGGPPFFFVDGLAAGFGFNRTLVVPDVSGVYTFPLVAWANGVNAPSSSPGGNVAQQVEDTMSLLAQSGVIAPAIGEYWFAAGLHFSSFEIVESFAVAIVKIGTEIEIDILGLSTLSIPPDDPSPVAEAQLELEATIRPDSGFFGISGQLTPNSYLLSKSCKLTGGFAIYMWFTGPHAGDFVTTLGGYSPNYTVPAHYPQVPRLGLNWQISSALSVTGDIYFALTSSAVMAGGGMSAVWQAGDIRAWFDVEVDFLMIFKPFHYYMSGRIELGASVRISLLFTHITISIHLGVGVKVWGPSFAGEVDVDLSIVSFTISFGAGRPGGNTTIEWSDFATQLLPSQSSGSSSQQSSRQYVQPQVVRMRRAMMAMAAGDAPPPPPPAALQIVPGNGLQKTLSSDDGALNWLVDGQTFQLSVQTVIPLKTYKFDGTNVVLAPDAMQPQDDEQPSKPITPNQTFGVGPSGIDSDKFDSCLEISVTSTEDSQFDCVYLLGNISKAMWEKRDFDSNAVPQNVDPVNGTTISNVLTGFKLVPTVPPPDQTPLPIPLENLQYTIDENIQKFVWSVPVVQTTDSFASQTVPGTIAATPATSNRPSIINAVNRAGLSVATAVDVSLLASAATYYLLASPMLRYLGEAKAGSQ